MEMSIDSDIGQAVRLLCEARQVTVFAGAGLSAESGLPTFRDQGGLWEGHRVEDVATPEGFRRDPVLVWQFYAERQKRQVEVEPNAGHLALAEMEALFDSFLLVTQNVDNLSERAGSQRMLKIHGDLMTVRCTQCHDERCLDDYINPEGLRSHGDLPVCDLCGGLVRPGVVWFGEILPPGALEQALLHSGESDVLITVGSSGMVGGGYGLAEATRAAHGSVIEINPNETYLSRLADVLLRKPSAEALPLIVQELQRQQAAR